MHNRDTKAILDYHEVTKHSEWSVRTSRHVLDWENQPFPFKVYRGLEPIPLVRDFAEKEVPALEALARAPEPGGPLTALRPRSDAEVGRESLDRVIRRRGSTRVFDPRRSIAFEELSTALDGATQAIPADFLEPPGATLLDLYLIVNAVEGVAPGAYRYHRAARSLELLRAGSFRRVAGRLGLGQELPAQAAVNVYSVVDLPRVLERFGNRGYRAAQLEGGITGGRLYLAAYAQRLGATGLTFFDDAVIDFFSPQAAGSSVLFLTALGHPDRLALGLTS